MKNMTSCFLCAVIGLFSLSTAQLNWEKISPSPDNPNLKSIALANGLFVAVGDSGTIKTSTDGVAWVAQKSGVRYSLNSVAYGRALFMIVGDSGLVLTSSDGITWDKKTSGTTEGLSSVVFGDSLFLAVGNNRTVIVSHDGTDWSDTSLAGAGYFGKVTYGNGRFIAPLSSFNPFGDEIVPDSVLSSPDGRNWTSVPLDSIGCMLWSIAYGNGLFVLAGTSSKGYYTSINGLNWNYHAYDTTYVSPYHVFVVDVIFAGNRFLTLNEYGISTSQDGISWTKTEASLQYLTALAARDSTWVGVGNYGVTLSSTDGKLWSGKTPMTTSSLQWVMSGNGLSMTLTWYDTILASSNGTEWSKRVLSANHTYWNYFGNVGTYCHDRFFLLGGNREGALITTSFDGITWSDQVSHVSGNLKDVAYGNGLFVAVGVSYNSIPMVTMSSDGISWTSKNFSSGFKYEPWRLESIAFGNGKFVASGIGGVKEQNIFAVSSDGITWSSQMTGLANADKISDITFGDSQFVAVSGSGKIMTSHDGITWENGVSNLPCYLSAVAFGNHGFVTVGNGSSSFEFTKGKVYHSADGKTWTEQNIGNAAMLNSVVFDGNHFIVVGDDGTILTSSHNFTSISSDSLQKNPAESEDIRLLPNPFNPTTNLSFNLPKAGHAVLTVYDAAGKLVGKLLDGSLAAGTHSVNWNGSDMASGMYVFRLKVGNKVEAKRAVLMR